MYHCPGATSNASPGASFLIAGSGFIPSRAFTPVVVSVALKEGLRERTLKRRGIPPPADRGRDRVALR